MSNDVVDRIRIAAFMKHGGNIRIVRLHTADGNPRLYVCQIKHDRIISILASGIKKQQILNQL